MQSIKSKLSVLLAIVSVSLASSAYAGQCMDELDCDRYGFCKSNELCGDSVSITFINNSSHDVYVRLDDYNSFTIRPFGKITRMPVNNNIQKVKITTDPLIPYLSIDVPLKDMNCGINHLQKKMSRYYNMDKGNLFVNFFIGADRVMYREPRASDMTWHYEIEYRGDNWEPVKNYDCMDYRNLRTYKS